MIFGRAMFNTEAVRKREIFGEKECSLVDGGSFFRRLLSRRASLEQRLIRALRIPVIRLRPYRLIVSQQNVAVLLGVKYLHFQDLAHGHLL